MYIFWWPYAGQTAVGFWALALVLFGGITAGVIEENHIFWQVCLAFMILSLMGAIIASVVSWQEMRRRQIAAVWGGMGSSAQVEGDVEVPPVSNLS